jgi:hypothetical protein
MDTIPTAIQLPCVRCVGDGNVSHDIPVITESESESDGHDQGSEADVVCKDNETTVPPLHIEEEIKNEEARAAIRQTCSQLLLSVEEIKMALLQIQYAVHTGALGAAAVETTKRSGRIWNWNNTDVLNERAVHASEFAVDVFDPSNIAEELTLPHGVYDVFEGGCITTNNPDIVDDVDDGSNELSKLAAQYAESGLCEWSLSSAEAK